MRGVEGWLRSHAEWAEHDLIQRIRDGEAAHVICTAIQSSSLSPECKANLIYNVGLRDGSAGRVTNPTGDDTDDDGPARGPTTTRN